MVSILLKFREIEPIFDEYDHECGFQNTDIFFSIPVFSIRRYYKVEFLLFRSSSQINFPIWSPLDISSRVSQTKFESILVKIEVAPLILSFAAYLYKSKNQCLKIPTFLASNHQNLTPIDIFKPFFVLGYSINLKYQFFVKSLNFWVHGTLLTAFAAPIAVRSLVVREKLSDFSATSRDLSFHPNVLKFEPIDLWGNV